MQINKILSKTVLFSDLINLVTFMVLKTFRFLIPGKRIHANVTVVSLHKIGDMIFTLPALKAILDYYYPTHSIILLCWEDTEPIYKSFITECRTVTLSHKMFGWHDRLASDKARDILEKTNPGTIIDLTCCMTSASLIFNSKAKQIIGSNRNIFKGIYTQFQPLRTKPPLTKLYTDAIKTAIPLVENYFVRQSEPKYPGKRILIHPFAGWKAKEWGINKFITLGLILNKDYKTDFIIQSGSIPEEIISEIEAAGMSVFQTSTIKELIEEIKMCSFLISNDTGCIYLAAELGISTFTIYGPTNPEYSLPQGKHGFIKNELKCSPITDQYCFTFGGQEGCPSFECMRGLTVETVAKKLRQFLIEIKFEFPESK